MAITEEETNTIVEIIARADVGERQLLAFTLALNEADKWRAKRILMESGTRRKPVALMFVTNDPETIRRVRTLLKQLESDEDAAEQMERKRP